MVGKQRNIAILLLVCMSAIVLNVYVTVVSNVHNQNLRNFTLM